MKNSISQLYRECPGSNKEHIKLIKAQYDIQSIKACDNAIIFGTGILGNKLFNKFRQLGVQISAFSDNDKSKWGDILNGVPILPPIELKENPRRKIIIASKYVREIAQQLSKSGLSGIIPHYVLSIIFPADFPNEFHKGAIKVILKDRREIEKVYSIFSDAKSKMLFLRLLKLRISLSPSDLPEMEAGEYYPGKFWKLEKQSTYVDVGAFDGDTLKTFLSHSKGSFSRYIAIEPDSANFKKLLASIPDKYKHKITPILAGAGSKKGRLSFCSYGRDDSMVSEKGGDRVRIIPLDALDVNRDITEIKIDVEGFEPEVLKGARQIIENKRPKLAVCVYHRPWHLWKIPLQILEYNPNYSFYLRHHGREIYETVLYAI